MTDPLGASPVDREYSIALLDPAVPVRQTSSNHFVHLWAIRSLGGFFMKSVIYYIKVYIILYIRLSLISA